MAPQQPPFPPPRHGRGDEPDDEIDGMIARMGCGKEYYALEECLGEHDRDWTKCQALVKTLQACNLARRRSAQPPARDASKAAKA